MKLETHANKRFEVSMLRLGDRKCIVVYEEELSEAVPQIKVGMLKASRLLDTRNDIIINVFSTNDKLIKKERGGIAGFAVNDCTLSLGINRSASRWKRFVTGEVAHEFSHVVRFQRIGNKHQSILDCLVQEGLAQCFAEQVTGRVRPWSTAITHEQARKVWAKLGRKLNREDRTLYERVFFKQKDKEFPHWSGYTIGYLMIKAKLRELGKDWNGIIGMKSKALKGNAIF